MRLALYTIWFFVVIHGVYCFPNLWRGITGQRKSKGQSQEQGTDDDISENSFDDNEVQIPEKLFSTGLAPRRNTFCHQARVEFGKLCGLRSAFERTKLASLVTNCHLEVSGRPVFEWDPVKKLANAESDYVHLVMQFLPLMNDVCQKAGYDPFLAQLAADTESTDELRSRIIELQHATERLFEANRESSEFVSDYMSMSADASKKLTKILELSAAIKDANDAIDFQKEAFHQEADNIKSELREFTKNSLSLFDSMFGRFDGFQSQISNMANTVGQIQSDSRVTTMFLKEPLKVLSNTSVPEFSQASPLSDNPSSPFLSFRKLGILKKLILGPLKLSERIRQLEGNAFLGPFAKDVFSSVQLLLILLSVYIAYIMLTTVTRIVEAVVQFAAVLRPSQPMLARLARLFRKSDQLQTRFHSLNMEQQLLERISANVSRVLSSAAVTEKFANIVRNESTDRSIHLLLTRISKMDEQFFQFSQDIHLLHHAIQSIHRQNTEGKGSCNYGAITPSKRVGALEASATSAPLLPILDDDSRESGSKHQKAVELVEKTTAPPNDYSRDEQLECTDDRSLRAVDHKESDTRDRSSRRSSQKAGIGTPRRELKRRRSSRRRA